MKIPRGLHVARLDGEQFNPREVAFVEQWEHEHEYSDLLAALFRVQCAKGDSGAYETFGAFHSHERMPLGEPTERDRIVAATVIQWLGSNIGMGMLMDALNKCGYGLKYPERTTP